jgi:hypothetical protein
MPTSTYDENCQTTYGYNSSGTIQNTTSTCDNPLKTQTGGLISFLEVTLLVGFGYWFLTHHGKKELS